MQGVIKSYDPSTGDGVVLRDTDLSEFDLAADALDGSIFRMLRQGQRVVFDLDDAGAPSGFASGARSTWERPASRPGVCSLPRQFPNPTEPTQRRVGDKEFLR